MAKTESGTRLDALAAKFESSGMSRREFCQRHGIALSTLDYYRYRTRRKKAASVRLLPVSLLSTGNGIIRDGLAVVLGNGRRIEFRQPFTDTDLAHLLRTVEQA